MPARCSRWDSNSPAGPAPTIPTCVRIPSLVDARTLTARPERRPGSGEPASPSGGSRTVEVEPKERRMADHSDVPPTRTVEPMDPPPASASPTSAMLKGGIDSGRTGDKKNVFDPGLSPLGTDDEAAGTPPSAQRVALARRMEGFMKGSRKATAAYPRPDGALALFIGFIV